MLSWVENAWENYLYRQQQQYKKTLKRINTLIKDITRQPFEGLGDPEPLKHNWSRRIDRKHSLHSSMLLSLLMT